MYLVTSEAVFNTNITTEGQMQSELRLVGLKNSYTPPTPTYDPVIIERTIGLVLGPSTAL